MRTKEIEFQLFMNIGLIMTGIVDLGFSSYMVTNLDLFFEVLPLSDNTLLILGVVVIIGAIIEIISKISKNIKMYGLLEDEKGI